MGKHQEEVFSKRWERAKERDEEVHQLMEEQVDQDGWLADYCKVTGHTGNFLAKFLLSPLVF